MSETAPDRDTAFLDPIVGELEAYLSTVTLVATGEGDESSIPILVLALSRVLAAGARLGATRDVLPAERFEPDAGPDTDLDPVRLGLAAVLADADAYLETADPHTLDEVVPGSLADDLTSVAAEIGHGLSHLRAGSRAEALWWWQFTYLSSWGPRGAGALRALLSLMSHSRLDVDPDVAAEARFDALHSRI